MEIPSGFLARMKELLGEDYPLLLSTYDCTPTKALRLNPFKPAALSGKGYNLSEVPYAKDCYYYSAEDRPGAAPLHDAGAYYIQEPSAIFPVELLPIKKGDRVLDVCAAPGGKTGQLAAKVGQDGFVLANEVVPQRAKTLLSNVERLGLTNTAVTMLEASELVKLYPAYFDAVAVDAPCSGEGMFRKEAEAVAAWSQESVRGCAERSLSILLSAADCVANEGYLLYSTCTFSVEENEGNVQKFLRLREDFELLTPPDFILPYTKDGISLPDVPTERCRRFYPYFAVGEG